MVFVGTHCCKYFYWLFGVVFVIDSQSFIQNNDRYLTRRKWIYYYIDYIRRVIHGLMEGTLGYAVGSRCAAGFF